jgi:ABC-type multidrug transport system ATPase subunit
MPCMPAPAEPKTPARAPALVETQALAFAYPGLNLLTGLSFAIHPGLTWVHGGEGRGKSTLLRLLSGALLPTGGTLQRQPGAVFHETMTDKSLDPVPARAWLQATQARYPDWDIGQAQRLVQGFDLADHMAKPIHMLSTGSRRKLGLVAAVASGARLTLLDQPFAALDAASRTLLAELLAEAAQDEVRAWVLADYELPAALAGVRLAGLVELGD